MKWGQLKAFFFSFIKYYLPFFVPSIFFDITDKSQGRKKIHDKKKKKMWLWNFIQVWLVLFIHLLNSLNHGLSFSVCIPQAYFGCLPQKCSRIGPLLAQQCNKLYKRCHKLLDNVSVYKPRLVIFAKKKHIFV